MILWLASYPRSGNSFLRVVLKVASASRAIPPYAERRSTKSGRAWIPGRSLSDMALSADLCPVKTHEFPGDDEHPAIYVVRDGRDALVSYAHYALEPSTGSWHRSPVPFAAAGALRHDAHFGGWAQCHRLDSHEGPTEVIRFEDLIVDPLPVVERALARLGIRRQPAPARLPSFAELHERAPRVLSHRACRLTCDEMPRGLEDLFWSRHGGAMRRRGYSPASARSMGRW